jgi:hypothetical protein
MKFLWPAVIVDSHSLAISSDGTIYLSASDYSSVIKGVYGVNSNGTEKWFFPLGKRAFSSPAIGSDGTVYIGSPEEFKLYAIGTQPAPEFTTTIIFIPLSLIALFIIVKRRKN